MRRRWRKEWSAVLKKILSFSFLSLSGKKIWPISFVSSSSAFYSSATSVWKNIKFSLKNNIFFSRVFFSGKNKTKNQNSKLGVPGDTNIVAKKEKTEGKLGEKEKEREREEKAVNFVSVSKKRIFFCISSSLSRARICAHLRAHIISLFFCVRARTRARKSHALLSSIDLYRW